MNVRGTPSTLTTRSRRESPRPGRVVTARDPIQHARQQPVVDCAIAMQRLGRTTQGNLALRDMANPGDPNRHALAVARPDRPGVAAVSVARRLPGLCGHSARQPARSLPRRATPRCASTPAEPGPDRSTLASTSSSAYSARSDDVDRPSVRPFLRFLTGRRTLLSRLLCSWRDARLGNVIKPQGLEPLQRSKFRSHSAKRRTYRI